VTVMGAQHYDTSIFYPDATRTWVPSHCLCCCRYDGLGVLKYVHAPVSSVGLGVESKVAILIICTLNPVSFLLDAIKLHNLPKRKEFSYVSGKKMYLPCCLNEGARFSELDLFAFLFRCSCIVCHQFY
jgi:hypothetical protein